MIGYEEIKKEFKPGVTFYEQAGTICFEFLCSTDVVEEDNQLKWTAINYDGAKTHFLVTKGMEHYGPKLYWNSDNYR